MICTTPENLNQFERSDSSNNKITKTHVMSFPQATTINASTSTHQTMNEFDYTPTNGDVINEDWIDSLLSEDEQAYKENYDDTIRTTLK